MFFELYLLAVKTTCCFLTRSLSIYKACEIFSISKAAPCSRRTDTVANVNAFKTLSFPVKTPHILAVYEQACGPGRESAGVCGVSQPKPCLAKVSASIWCAAFHTGFDTRSTGGSKERFVFFVISSRVPSDPMSNCTAATNLITVAEEIA